MVGAEPVELGPVLPPQMKQVLEALSADECRARASALEERVRGDGRPMREPVDLISADRCRCRKHGFFLPARGWNLGRQELVLVREQDRIRERAADVDAEDGHAMKLQL
jgi:hypothetical protein